MVMGNETTVLGSHHIRVGRLVVLGTTGMCSAAATAPADAAVHVVSSAAAGQQPGLGFLGLPCTALTKVYGLV